jgi:hypothetical protein
MPSCCSLPVDPDELAIPLPESFARRLRELYGLAQSPQDLAEFVTLLRVAGRLPQAEWLVSPSSTRHEVVLEGRCLYVHCALDALMYPMLVGQDAQVRSRCPECESVIEVTVHSRELVAPQSAVFWLGASAEGGACCTSELGSTKQYVCPFIHLFDNPEHLEQWRAKNDHVLGVPLTLSQAFALAKGLCTRGDAE